MGFFSSGKKAAKKAARRKAIGFQDAQVLNRDQQARALTEFRTTEATTRGDVEARNIRAFEDLDFRRDLEAEKFAGFEQRLGDFDVREQERFDLGISREDARLGRFDLQQDRAEAVDIGQRGELSRFGDLGRRSFEDFQRGSTPGGFGRNIDEIISGPAFQGLRDERKRELLKQLSSSGLRRSGTALESISDLTSETAFGIEGQLSGRQFQGAQAGLSALATARGGRFDPRFQGTTTARAQFEGSPLGAAAGREDTQLREARGFDFIDPTELELILGEAGAEAQGFVNAANATNAFRGQVFNLASNLAPDVSFEF